MGDSTLIVGVGVVVLVCGEGMGKVDYTHMYTSCKYVILYSRKIWRGIKFGGLAV